MSPFQPGDLIGGRYRLQRIIGAGAMGTVWSARNESTDRDFALKLMLPDAAKNPVALQRFFQEAKASGRLRHRSIVEVYDLGRIEAPSDPHAGTPYLVMELLEGEPLDSLLRRQKRLPVGTALRIIRDLARGLDVAHKQRIVHRDLKPANVFLHKTLEGAIVPKILDFGVSKLVGPTNFDAVETSAGTVLGSPAYMSPEQASGDADVDGRSDVWSLGVILYKCVVGTVPFSAPNYNALMMAIANKAHPPIESQVEGLPADLSVIVDRCLTKERDERFESAKELADSIDRVLTARPNLEHVELTALVIAPVELPVDDARTIATNHGEQAGTLAATELERVVGPSSAPVPALDRTRHMELDPPQSTRAKVSSRVRVAAGVLGIASLLAMAVFVSTRRNDVPGVAPAASVVSPASSANAPASPSPTPSVAPFASPAPSAVASAVPSASASAVKPHPKSYAKPKLPKPAHEGVTSSGI